MGLRVRKTIKIAPGIRTTISKSGVSYSAGGKYGRVTKTARGQVVGTAKLPGSGVSYSQRLSPSKPQRHRQAPQMPATLAPAQTRHVARPAPALKWLGLAAAVGFAVSLILPPLMLLELPLLVFLIIVLIKHLRAVRRAEAMNRQA